MDASTAPVILLTVANPKGDLTNVGQEFERVRESLEGTGLDVQQRPYASLDGLLKALQDYREQMAVFHYGGHATELGLLLETGSNGALALAGGLAKVLSAQSSLRLVFLNGCSTEPQIREFHRAGVPVVIGTKKPISDIGASRFAEWFYRSLSTGANIGQAFKEAEGALGSAAGRSRDVVKESQNDNVGGEDNNNGLNPGGLWLLSAKDESAIEWGFAQALDDPYFGLSPLPERDLPPKPYKHLSFFTEAEAELFFGRGWEIRDLYFRVTTPTTDPILLLYGQSGVGKSSLLDAGLTPRLRSKGNEVRYVRRDASLGLLGTLAKALEATSNELNAAWNGLEARAGKPVVVILDQLEEAYTRKASDTKASQELSEFSQALYGLFAERKQRPKGKLILSFRKEWVAEIKDGLKPNRGFYSELPLLKPLDLAGIQQAIVGPATTERLQHKYDLSLDPELPQEMAHDLLDRNSPIAPTLQLTLTKMWDQVDRPATPHHFDSALYAKVRRDDLGGILDAQLSELEQVRPDEVRLGLALDLLHLHTTDLGTATQKSEDELMQVYGRERADQINSLVQAAKNVYLLADPPGSELKATRLSHDTLAPYVRERFEKSEKPGPRAKRILESRVVDWDEGEKGIPLDVYDLALVEQGKVGMRSLSTNEQRLLEASQSEARKKAQQRKNNQQFRRWATIGLGVLVLALGFAWWNSDGAAKTAQRQRMVSIAQSLANRALALKDDPGQFTLANLLATQAYRLHEQNSGSLMEQIDEALRTSISKPVLYRSQELKGHQGSVLSLALSPDGQTLASGSDDNNIRLWKITDPSAEPLLLKGTDPILSLAFSTNGKTLASGSNGTIQLRELSNLNNEPEELLGIGAEVTSMAFNSNGEILAYGAFGSGANLRYLVNTTMAEFDDRSLPGSGPVDSIVFSPDRKTLAWGTGDYDIYLRNMSEPEVKPKVLKGHENAVSSMAFSPDGKTLASGSYDSTVRLWKLSQPKAEPIVLKGHQESILSVAFSPNGNFLASGSMDHTIRLWKLDGLQTESVILAGHRGSVRSITFSLDGKTLISGSDDKTIRMWKLDEPKVEPLILKGPRFEEYSLAFSPNSQTLATGRGDGSILLWKLNEPKSKPRVLAEHEGSVRSIAFSRDGQMLASGSGDRTIRLWKLSEPKAKPVVLEEHEDGVTSVVFSRDGQTLASGSGDRTVRLWKLSEPKAKSEVLKGQHGAIYSVAFSPDGQTLASGDWDNTIRLWKLSDLKASPRYLRGHEEPVFSIAFSKNGKILASVSRDKTVRLWNLDAPNSSPQVLREHQDYVWSIAFSPDGKTLASGSGDRTIRLWRLDQPEAKPVVLKGHRDAVLPIAFSPDGETLASGSRDGTIRLWRTIKALSELACWVLVRNLSQDEWNRYIGSDIPYERTCPNLPPGEGAPAQAK